METKPLDAIDAIMSGHDVFITDVREGPLGSVVGTIEVYGERFHIQISEF